MKNFAITLLVLLLTSLFITVNAQEWTHEGIYLSPTNDEKIFLGNGYPYAGDNLTHQLTDDEFNYRIKLLEFGGENGGIFSYTEYKPSLHAMTFENTAVYAQTVGARPAVLGIANYTPDFEGVEGTQSVWMDNFQAGVAGLSETTGVYGQGNEIGGWFNSGDGIGLYATSSNGFAAQFSGDVNFVDGKLFVGSYTPGTDTENYVAAVNIKASGSNEMGISAVSENSRGVSGYSTNGTGIRGTSLNNIAVYGRSTDSIGVQGKSMNDAGVYGLCIGGNEPGVEGMSWGGYGGHFVTQNGEAGLYAGNYYGDKAAHFEGNVQLNGTITGNVGAAGAIKIQTTRGYTNIGALNQYNSHFQTSLPQFHFDKKIKSAGAMYATGFHITSDKRLKKDVSEFQYGLDEVLQLNPLTYDYTGKGGTTSGDYNVGLFAQDLQKVAPEFVTEFTHRDMDEAGAVKNEKDYLQVYDTGIKYMLINATKEQQEIIDNQATQIETLEETLAELQATVVALMDNQTNEISPQSIRLQDNTSNLEQNQPNPFSTNTSIKYNLPENTSNAVITIYNTTGQVMHQERIAHTGTGEIQLQANKLQAGTYSYSLTVDGRIVDTKQMVITK